MVKGQSRPRTLPALCRGRRRKSKWYESWGRGFESRRGHHPSSAEPLSREFEWAENRRSPAVLRRQPGAPKTQRTSESLSEGPILSATWGYGGFGPRSERIEIAEFNGAISNRKLKFRLGGLGNRERISGLRLCANEDRIVRWCPLPLVILQHKTNRSHSTLPKRSWNQISARAGIPNVNAL